ncbi:MAG: DUF2029 domain-containing protein [Bacteroidales bacterium]|nr:DUF2029 domain-containing protein [Bacteroidales bacterium]
MNKVRQIISKPVVIITLFTVFSIIASTQSLLRSPKEYTYQNETYTQTSYNNYQIFKSSFHHLVDDKDLYILYLDEHWDLYKYTPSFAAFFGFFASFPDWLGLNLWNLLNALVLAFAVYYLPKATNTQKGLILLICAIELITSLQNTQSNGLIAGLMVLTFVLLERDKPLWATLCVVFSVYIKLFGVLGFILFLFYPKKNRAALYSAMWAIVLFFLPLIFVSWQQYTTLLASFADMLTTDHDNSYGYSVLGWLHSWFGWNGNKFAVVGIGALLLILPMIQIKEYSDQHFRIKILASVLIWMVIFNHKAESPTFIIAMAGVALWFIFAQKNWVNITLFIIAFVFTSLSPTDIFPKSVRDNIVNPYCLKGVACILVWIKINIDLYTEHLGKRKNTHEIKEHHSA